MCTGESRYLIGRYAVSYRDPVSRYQKKKKLFVFLYKIRGFAKIVNYIAILKQIKQKKLLLFSLQPLFPQLFPFSVLNKYRDTVSYRDQSIAIRIVSWGYRIVTPLGDNRTVAWAPSQGGTEILNYFLLFLVTNDSLLVLENCPTWTSHRCAVIIIYNYNRPMAFVRCQ